MNHFRNILVDVDASAMAQPALAWAESIARRINARIRLVHVVSPTDGYPSAFRPHLHEELVRVRRQQLVRLAAKSPDVIDSVAVLEGSAADALIREVDDVGIDLLVRHHHRDLTIGPGEASTDVELFRRCACPVVAVGYGALASRPKIAVAVDVDPSDPAKQAAAAALVDTGLMLANAMAGSLSLVHAWQPPGQVRVALHASNVDYHAYRAASRCEVVRVLASLADAGEDHRLTRRLTVEQGSVATVIPAFAVAEGIDLLVVGTSARTGLARLLQANTAERLLTRVPCSVMAVKIPALVAA